jgi:hypothetical protein
MQMKQPAWESMPALDVRALSSGRLAMLSDFYDSLSSQKLESLAKLNSDPVRRQIDLAVCNALDIPAPSFIRELLDREPGLNAKDIEPRAAQVDADLGNAAEIDEDTAL